MKPGKHEELLLDFHLDRLDPADQTWLEEQLRNDPNLRAKSDRLGDLLRPLDFWQTSAPPSRFEEKVLEHIAGARDREAVSMAAVESGGSAPRGLVFRMREFLAVAACLTLLASVMVPGISAIRSRAQMTRCADNLAAIHQGTAQYGADFAEMLPFAGSVPQAAWLPGGTMDRPFASNSRHVYRLLKARYVPDARKFVCPSNLTGRPMTPRSIANREDFASSDNISYASLNLGGLTPNLRPPVPIALVSDANPLFVTGRFDGSIDADLANSPAHGGRGQTVLALDGHVEMLRTPIYGANHDNLWLAGNIHDYVGTEVQTRTDDAFLVPGFPTTKTNKKSNR